MCQCPVERLLFSYNPSIVFVAFSHLKGQIYTVKLINFSGDMHFCLNTFYDFCLNTFISFNLSVICIFI